LQLQRKLLIEETRRLQPYTSKRHKLYKRKSKSLLKRFTELTKELPATRNTDTRNTDTRNPTRKPLRKPSRKLSSFQSRQKSPPRKPKLLLRKETRKLLPSSSD